MVIVLFKKKILFNWYNSWNKIEKSIKNSTINEINNWLKFKKSINY